MNWPDSDDPRGIVSFMYHEVSDDATASGFQRRGARRYLCSPAEFADQMQVISDHATPPALVTQIDLTQYSRNVLLTFDDGGLSALYAGDELLRRGWRGHFFVVTNRIGSPHFLDEAGIRYLRSCGHLIGSHSHSHPDIFPQLSNAQMLAEWRTSCDIIAQLLGEPCTTASIPGGDLDEAAIITAEAVGIQHLFTSEPWLIPRRHGDCWLHGRFVITSGLRRSVVSDLVALRGWRLAMFQRQCKVIARRSLAPLYRMYVRRMTSDDLTPKARR